MKNIIFGLGLLLAACGGESQDASHTTGPETRYCAPFSHYVHAEPLPEWGVMEVYLLASGFTDNGCAYSGEVAFGWKGSGLADAGRNEHVTHLTFDDAGLITSCETETFTDCAFDATVVVPAATQLCGEGAMDIERNPMPFNGCDAREPK